MYSSPGSHRPARGPGSATPWTPAASPPRARRRSQLQPVQAPQVSALLDSAAAAISDDGGQGPTYAELDKIYREGIPCVPLMYRPTGVLRVQPVQLGELPDREEPVRSAVLDRALASVGLQDQTSRQLSDLGLTQAILIIGRDWQVTAEPELGWMESLRFDFVSFGSTPT